MASSPQSKAEAYLRLPSMPPALRLAKDLTGMLRYLFLCVALALPVGCAVQPSAPAQEVEVAFSPDAGAEALVLKTIGVARQSIRLAGYSFTSPAVSRGKASWGRCESSCG